MVISDPCAIRRLKCEVDGVSWSPMYHPKQELPSSCFDMILKQYSDYLTQISCSPKYSHSQLRSVSKFLYRLEMHGVNQLERLTAECSRPKSSYPEIFLDKGGYSPISARNVSDIARIAFARSGVNCKNRRSGPHALRTSLATALLAEGNSYFTVQKLLDHADVQTSKSYAKADVEQLRICALSVPAPTGNFKTLLQSRNSAV